MSAHPLAVAAATWTTDAGTLARAQQIGDQLDALVAEALALSAPIDESRTMLRAAVVQLDRLPQWFVVNMPGLAFQKYYEQQRRNLHARAVALFGTQEGQRVAPALEHEPYTPTRSLWR